ncbi:hypothetical protein TanjilG_31187 [Lupinus angustifolius]|uniref:RRM domain-containing protein n=1 Tax=Lupinus angustifolius TaxID=3871 RepID=A0A1J7IAC3_LUPAN|nr:hypothetical protein TanjilG_31187 [Lupinus angustifolius]
MDSFMEIVLLLRVLPCNNNDSQRVVATALMLKEDLHKFGQSRLERNDFCLNSVGMVNLASREIYFTFPPDSTFREEDVSNYLSIYGPFQDVRIPYQQKHMFGFVTFVKPYKEKGKVLDKTLEEQADFQQAVELQSKRLMGLLLHDIKKHHQGALSTGSPIPSSTHSPNIFNQNRDFNILISNSGSRSAPGSTASSPVDQPMQQTVNISVGKEMAGNGDNENTNGNGNGKESSNDLQECLEHNLPDSPFASPTKAIGDYTATFSNGPSEALNLDAPASANSKFNTSRLLPAASGPLTANFPGSLLAMEQLERLPAPME